jgi:hypothetical protein
MVEENEIMNYLKDFENFSFCLSEVLPDRWEGTSKKIKSHTFYKFLMNLFGACSGGNEEDRSSETVKISITQAVVEVLSLDLKSVLLIKEKMLDSILNSPADL